MNKRIKELRKALDLTQVRFAEILRIKQNTVATYEMGRTMPSDAIIGGICREFNVNEEWLRTGSGEMFNPAPNSELDALADRYHLSANSRVLIEKFINLSPEQRKMVIDFVRSAAESMTEDGAFSVPTSRSNLIDGVPRTPEELEFLSPPVEEIKTDVG